jgi:acyl carrier protein phosphodiesterase
MNYLAHAYLSFNNPDILLGNMISDFVKGKKQYDYPIPIQQGIQLHRAIDTFTDNHLATKKAKEIFRKDYRLYSGAFVDIVYDHFLANDTNEFSTKKDLKNFATNSYAVLSSYSQWMPEPFNKMFPYMKQQDWFYNYQHLQGIENSFNGMVRRAAYLTESKIAFTLFVENYDSLQEVYSDFFKDVKNFAIHHLHSMNQH